MFDIDPDLFVHNVTVKPYTNPQTTMGGANPTDAGADVTLPALVLPQNYDPTTRLQLDNQIRAKRYYDIYFLSDPNVAADTPMTWVEGSMNFTACGKAAIGLVNDSGTPQNWHVEALQVTL